MPNANALTSLIRQGIKNVPAVKYALGLAGVAACIQVALTAVGGNEKLLVVGLPVTIILMVMLFLFARLAATNLQLVLVPVQVLVWFATISFMFMVGCTFSAVAFGEPKLLHDYIFPTSTPPASKANILVATVPDTTRIEANAYRAINYEFHESNGVAFQVETEDTQFQTLEGAALSDPCRGCRILGGSFSVGASTTHFFTDNVYMPPDVAQRARDQGQNVVHLKTLFNCRDANGNESHIPAVLKIYF